MNINYSNEPIRSSLTAEHSVFLAGPTLRNEPFEKSWRKYACDKLKELGYKGLVYVPEFETGTMKPDLTEQAGWERKGLTNADIILFYIPRKIPELAGYTTNVEFGMWLAKKPDNCMLCIPEWAEKVNYLKWLWKQEVPEKPIYSDLDDALKAIIHEQVNHKKRGKHYEQS